MHSPCIRTVGLHAIGDWLGAAMEELGILEYLFSYVFKHANNIHRSTIERAYQSVRAIPPFMNVGNQNLNFDILLVSGAHVEGNQLDLLSIR